MVITKNGNIFAKRFKVWLSTMYLVVFKEYQNCVR